MIRFFCFAAAALSLTSCLKNDTNSCSATIVEPALSATGPKTIAVNQTATYTLTYAPQNTCGAFDSFLEQTGATANSLNVGVRVKYTSCNCPTASTTTQTTYTFKPTQPGTYYLNFLTNTGTGYVADTLVVQ